MAKKSQKILAPTEGAKGKARKGRPVKSLKSEPLHATSMPLVLPVEVTPDAVTESGVLAFRRRRNGKTSVLLITRRRSKKWGIPKGKIKPELSFAENAAKEAFEEAGVAGQISPDPIGVFRIRKSTTDQKARFVIEVWIYLLQVTEMYRDWPEKRKRQVRWVSCELAARLLQAPVLADLCHRLAQS